MSSLREPYCTFGNIWEVWSLKNRNVATCTATVFLSVRPEARRTHLCLSGPGCSCLYLWSPSVGPHKWPRPSYWSEMHARVSAHQNLFSLSLSLSLRQNTRSNKDKGTLLKKTAQARFWNRWHMVNQVRPAPFSTWFEQLRLCFGRAGRWMTSSYPARPAYDQLGQLTFQAGEAGIAGFYKKEFNKKAKSKQTRSTSNAECPKL